MAQLITKFSTDPFAMASVQMGEYIIFVPFL